MHNTAHSGNKRSPGWCYMVVSIKQKTNMNKLIFLFLILFGLVFSNCANHEYTKWKSQNYNFEVEYSNKWALYEKSDKKNRLLFGLMDISDTNQYHIDITTNSEYKKLSEKDYFNEMRKYYISLNKQNRFIKNETIKLHGENFNGYSFLVYDERYGTAKLYDIVKRDEGLVIGITISFPIDDKTSLQDLKIPDEILELDKHVKINGK